ncbi:MAG: helicase-related protein [Aestuariivita sp.]|nr:helicase-related protein [Aestuariivita sp.]
MQGESRVIAVLGPTNTGKTHFAIERMLGHASGMIGLPLRLLAREVYDKIVALRGPSVVALLTGEERIVPPNTHYWVCTVEALPNFMDVECVAIDEIQLCADPERGHTFTDRLLRSRGLSETLFLGSETMRGLIRSLVPGVVFQTRERLSQLVYTGSTKLSRMPARSAIVGFSADSVYTIAELIRRQKGGAAVVMGALSPRTRNAQVELYQSGEVDYLVATDAIGMGLNLDIDHVAFAELAKFDGRRVRRLAPIELAQIAGRAGRGMADGTFGVTGEAFGLEDRVAQRISEHRFRPVKKLNWRNSDVQFDSVEALIQSLDQAPSRDEFAKAREANDLMALKMLAADSSVLERISGRTSLQLLWQVCQIPDFRDISQAEHVNLLRVIFEFLHDDGRVPADWLARQISRIDHIEGDIDALSKRLAFIRTWTYVAQRSGWVADAEHWRGLTRNVENRISDALHEKLTKKFVDRRTSVLLRRLKQKEALLVDVNENGEVRVEGQFVGRLDGFLFIQDSGTLGAESQALKSASLKALRPYLTLRGEQLYNSPDPDIRLTEQGEFMWRESVIGRLAAGHEPLKPTVLIRVDESGGQDLCAKVERRLQHFLERRIETLFEPLIAMQRDDTLAPLSRGFAFRLVENFGMIARGAVADEVRSLDQDERKSLRKHGVRFGQFTIFIPSLLKPAPTQLRLLLWSLSQGFETFPASPPPGLVTIPVEEQAHHDYLGFAGYRRAGERAVRIDMLERLADLLRVHDQRTGFEANADMLSITGLTLDQFANLMSGLGYHVERSEREKTRPSDECTESAGDGTDAMVHQSDPSGAVEENRAGPDSGSSDVSIKDGLDTVGSVEVVPDPDIQLGVETDRHSPEMIDIEERDANDSPETEVTYVFSRRKKRARRSPLDSRSNPRKKLNRKNRVHVAKTASKNGSKSFGDKPKREKAIDPLSPFALALMSWKEKN